MKSTVAKSPRRSRGRPPMVRTASLEMWPSLNRPLPLAPDELHLWRASLDEPPAHVFAALRALLSTDEVERARKFFFERDRNRFVVARGILRTLLGSYAGIAPEKVTFNYGPNGKPELAGANTEIFFNIAHSDDVALFAFTRVGEIGVDVERIRDMPDWPSIAELSFSAEEREHLQACPEEKRREEFFAAWTRQEAILKATGTGLGRASPEASNFQLYSLEAGPGFAAALAIARSARQPSVRRFVAEMNGLLSHRHTL